MHHHHLSPSLGSSLGLAEYLLGHAFSQLVETCVSNQGWPIGQHHGVPLPNFLRDPWDQVVWDQAHGGVISSIGHVWVLTSICSSDVGVMRIMRVGDTLSPIITNASSFGILEFSFFSFSSFTSDVDYISLAIMSSSCSHYEDLQMRMRLTCADSYV